MFLSFIIPIYNCGKYVSQCLDSILSSKLPYSQYEVIIINDGSVDDGPQICQEYVNNYPNIKCLSQRNSGASTARNVGLKLVQGEYIWFVDGDDMIVPSFLDDFYRFYHGLSVDLICFNFQKYYKDKLIDVDLFIEKKMISGVDLLKYQYPNYLWNKIYRASSIQGRSFLDGTKNIEDMYFNMTTIIDMNKVLCIPLYGYKYNCANSSSTSRSLSLRNLVKLDQDSFCILNSLNNYVESINNVNKKNVLLENLNFSVIGHIFSLFRFYSPQRLKRRIAEYTELGLFPLSKCDNKKGNLFRLFANKVYMSVFVMRVGVFLKTFRNKKK